MDDVDDVDDVDEQGARRPLALWAVPRSVSTAFERVFIEREDFAVLHEPFSATYYHSAERRSDRFLDGPPDASAGWEPVLRDVLTPRDRPVFLKDMAYHATAFMSAGFAARFTNTFLVREPRAALASLHARHPTFTFEEAGYEQLARLYDLACEAAPADRPPAVVDADDLLDDPEGTLRAYCAAVDIPFVADALTWRPRAVPEFSRWDGWHDAAQRSTGLGRRPDPDPDDDPTSLPPDVEDAYRRCLPHYERLREARLVPSPA